MPSRDDAAVAARDPALPGLRLLLDPDRLAGRLAALLPDAGISSATPTYMRYKPGTSCVLGFRLRLATGAEVDCYAKAHAAPHYAIVRSRSELLRRPTALGQSRILLDDALLAVRPFPNDRELPVLRRLADEERRPKLLRALLNSSRRLAESAVLEPLRYKPERRFVGRLMRDGHPIALIKAYGEADFGPALAGAAFGVAAGGPPLLGALAPYRTLAVGWVRGHPLCPRAGASPTPSAMRAVGSELARLHLLDVDHPAIRSREGEARVLLDAAEAVAAICPVLGETALRLAGAISADLRAAPLQPRLLHGDFSADQVIQAAGGALTFIDWDNAAAGDAGADLGSFIARLEVDALEDGRIDAAGLAEALRDGYAQVQPVPRTTDLQVAAELLRLAAEPFRRRLPDWPDRMAVLLGRVAALYQPARRKPTAPLPTGADA